MKTENTSIRLKKVMDAKHLRQVDIIEMTKPYCEKYNVKFNKSDISQYVSGAVEPGQDKLSVLSLALGVSEAWLMGYDVPMNVDKTYTNNLPEVSFDAENLSYYSFTSSESKLLVEFNKLNNAGKDEAVNRVAELAFIPQYTNNNVTSINKKKVKYIPNEDDIRSLVARNGKKMTREEAIDFITTLFSDDDEDE
jgi:transcriptional regulator with XRE-family HTH domain